MTGTGSARVAASEPTDTGWKFSIESGSATTNATVSIRCLDPLTTEVSGHVHRLTITHKQATDRISALRIDGPNVQCPNGSTAIVGSHDVPAGVATLGNDPDVSGRTFWALNTTWSTPDGHG